MKANATKKYIFLGVVLTLAVLVVVYWDKLVGPAGLASLALRGNAVAATLKPLTYDSGTSETPQSGVDFTGAAFPITIFSPLLPY